MVLATDSDDAGDKLADKIATLGRGAPYERHRPPAGKDWNEWLQRCEREFIRSLGHANVVRSR